MSPIVVDFLATYRLTRLVTDDVFPPVKKMRCAVLNDESVDEWVKELVSCPWCASFWIAVGVRVARWVAPSLWDPLAKTLAASAVAGLLSTYEEK